MFRCFAEFCFGMDFWLDAGSLREIKNCEDSGASYIVILWGISSQLLKIYGCFQKLGYPQIIHFNRVSHSKPSILGYPYFWKHPYGLLLKILFFPSHGLAPQTSEDLNDVLEELLDGLNLTKDLSLQELSLKGFPISSKVKERPLGCWKAGHLEGTMLHYIPKTKLEHVRC